MPNTKQLITFNWRAYIAEFLGTFVFVFVASAAQLVNLTSEESNSLMVSFAVGLTYAAMLFATVSTSSGFLNPVVAISLWLAGKTRTIDAMFYVTSQILASIAAAFVLFFLFGEKSQVYFLGGPVLAVGTSIQQAVSLEAIFSAALVFVVFATIVDKRGPVSFGPIAAATVVTVGSMIAGPLTGGVLNPARAIGPLLVSGAYSSLLVWIVGPLVGALFGLVYDSVFLRKFKRK